MPYSDVEKLKLNKKEYYEKNKKLILEKRKEKYNSSIKIGEIFGELTVISKEDSYKSTSKTGKVSFRLMWKVKCSCGNEFITSGTKLRRKDTVMCRSCACKNRPQSERKYGNIEYAFKKLILDRAKDKIEVSISKEEFYSLAKNPCHYCGAPPKPRLYLTARDIELCINGLDRKDNSKGYSINNCVPCCKKCNTAKSTMSYDEFKLHIKRIYNHMWFELKEETDGTNGKKIRSKK